MITPLRSKRIALRLLISVWELAQFRWKYSFLSRIPKPPSDAKRVLFVTLSDWTPRLIFEGAMMSAFRLRGYRTAMLGSGSSRFAKSICRFLKIDLIPFDDLQSEVARAGDAALADDLLSRHTDFASLLNLEVEGVHIGRHVLSTVVKRSRKGSIDLQNPNMRVLLKDVFVQSLRSSRAAELLLDRYDISTIFFAERGYTPFGELLDAAVKRKLDAIQMVHGQRSDLLVLKRYHQENRTMHSFSFAKETWETIKALPWSKEEEQQFTDELEKSYRDGSWFNRKFLLQDKQIKSPDEVRAQLGLSPDKKVAVIYSHILWDATFFFGTNVFPDYEQWLIATVKAACKNDKVQWIVKLHPDYTWKMKQMGDTASPRDILALDDAIGELPPHIKIVLPDTDISTYSFFQITDYCLTVRGTVGLEAPCFGIPVFTAGTGRYSGLGFTHDFSTPDEYLSALSHLQDYPSLTPEETHLARKHAAFLFGRRVLPLKSIEMVPSRYASLNVGLEQQTELRFGSLKELESRNDLARLVEWSMDAKRPEDYLHPAFVTADSLS